MVFRPTYRPLEKIYRGVKYRKNIEPTGRKRKNSKRKGKMYGNGRKIKTKWRTIFLGSGHNSGVGVSDEGAGGYMLISDHSINLQLLRHSCSAIFL
jgi:hypothetical protein